MKLISQKEADRLQLTRYYTGIPCRNDHVSERRTQGGYCIKCQADAAAGWYSRNKPKMSESSAEYYQANREAIRVRQNAHRDRKLDLSQISIINWSD